jgi:hypothetical protein
MPIIFWVLGGCKLLVWWELWKENKYICERGGLTQFGVRDGGRSAKYRASHSKFPKFRLERSRCAADAFACAGQAVELMI